MKLLFGPGLCCDVCGSWMDDAFASMNPDAEDHWCDWCVDFRKGYIPK